MEHPTTIAVDLAKSVFEVAVSIEPGRVCQRRRLTRNQMASFFANRPPATVLMEACGTAHFWGRLLASSDTQVRRPSSYRTFFSHSQSCLLMKPQ